MNDSLSIEERKKIAQTAKLRVLKEMSDYIHIQCLEISGPALKCMSAEEFAVKREALKTYSKMLDKIVEIAERVYKDE